MTRISIPTLWRIILLVALCASSILGVQAQTAADSGSPSRDPSAESTSAAEPEETGDETAPSANEAVDDDEALAQESENGSVGSESDTAEPLPAPEPEAVESDGTGPEPDAAAPSSPDDVADGDTERVSESSPPDAVEPAEGDSPLGTEPMEPDLVRERLSRVGEYEHPENPVSVYSIRIDDAIMVPIEYIVRRSIKQAIEEDADFILLDINTPGGRLDVTLEIMTMLDRFPGETLAYVNTEAISAGAYISGACNDIYLAPRAVIGAAAVVTGTGEDIQETMKAKIDSYLRARVRSLTSIHPYRADVIRAMMDAGFVLEIDGKVVKPEKELLTLTAEEAMERFGNPPIPLLGRGIYNNVEELLDTRFGEGNYELVTVEQTSAERFARVLVALAPVLLGFGMVLLMIEFKTPGFGVFGIAGIALLLVVFASNYVAGLAGYEPVIVFLIGIVLVGVEIFLFPGMIVFAFTGVLCILGSLLWSLADIWPEGADEIGGPVGFSFELLVDPLQTLMLSILIMAVGLVIVWRFLPKTSFYGQLVLESALGSGSASDDAFGGAAMYPIPGSTGIAATDLLPHGEIEIDGKRYQAAVTVGSLRRGDRIVVEARRPFHVLVRRAED